MAKPREEQLGGITVLDENATGTITCTNASLTGIGTNISYAAATATPTFLQADRTTVGTGITLTLHAQDALIAAAGANVGGNITVRAGNAANGVASNTGGNVLIYTGTGATAAGSFQVYRGSDIAFGCNQFNVFHIDNTYLTWPLSLANVIIRHDDKNTAGSGGTFTVQAQGITGAVSGTGGTMLVKAGDNNATSGAETGGAATFRGGDVSGASGGANVGGNCTVRAGNASAGGTNLGGDLILSSGSPNSSSSPAAGNGVIVLQVAGVTMATINNWGGVYRWTFASANTFNSINQGDKITGGTGALLAISAQVVTAGAGANTGGELSAKGGPATSVAGQLGTGGPATFAGGNVLGVGTTNSGGTLLCNGGDVAGTFTVAGNGGQVTIRGGNVTNIANKISTGGKATLNGGDCSGAVAGATATGGHVLIRGGTAAGGATNYQGNIAFHVDPASWQSMEKGIFIAEATTVPTGNPVSGGYLYVEGGALKYKGPSGAVTEVGAA